MSLESLLDLRRPAVHCTRRPPRRERMACRFRPVDRNASTVLHIEKHLFSRARGDKNSGATQTSSENGSIPNTSSGTAVNLYRRLLSRLKATFNLPGRVLYD
jgi:hypothetical protein